jgi:hypothetical protein
MATIDPMASLKATAEQRTEDFDGVPLEPESPNRKAVKFDRSDRTFYIHPDAGIRIARVLWDDPEDGSPLYGDFEYVKDYISEHGGHPYEEDSAELSEDATAYVYEFPDHPGYYYGEVRGGVYDTFLGLSTDPDAILRRAAELDLEHIS